MNHPSEETLTRFAMGVAAKGENRAVVAHLIKKCAACARTLRGLLGPDFTSGDDSLALLLASPATPARPARGGGGLLQGMFPKE